MKKEVVHSSAYEVCKKDLLKIIEETSKKENVSFLEALGIDYDNMEVFISHHMPTIFKALFKPTKSQSIAVLLENTNSLQEFIAVNNGYSLFVEKFKEEEKGK